MNAQGVFLTMALSSGLSISVALGQGDLTPSRPPSPMMKTLTHIEPRTDVNTLAGDANSVIVIQTSGSYYRSGNLNVGKTYGNRINSEDVTLDLNGFRIRRLSGNSGQGTRIETGSGPSCRE